VSITAQINPASRIRPQTSTRSTGRLVTVAALAITSVVHIPIAIAHLHEVPYLGLLLAAFAISTAALAASLAVAATTTGWRFAFALAAGALITYVASRAFGLPLAADDHGDWANRSGLIAAIAESVVALLAIRNLSARNQPIEGNQK